MGDIYVEEEEKDEEPDRLFLDSDGDYGEETWKLLLTRSENIVMTIIIIRLTLSRLCRLLLVHQTDYIVNLSDFYSYSLIGKLTAFLQLQEFSQRNLIVGISTSTSRFSRRC